MNGTKKTWLGVLSFTPLLISIIFVIFAVFIYIKLIIGMVNHSLNYANGIEFLYSIIWLLVVAILLNVINYAVLIVFTIHIVKNKKIDDTTKILYLLGIYFLTTIIPIIYFFIEVAGKKNNEETKILKVKELN